MPLNIFGLKLPTISDAWEQPQAEKRRRREASAKRLEAERLAEIAYSAAEAKQDRYAAANFNPVYMSELIGKYKKSESPVELAYMDAIINGTDPGNVKPWEAQGTGALQQAKFNQTYGTPEQLREQQRQADANFGYDVKTPDPIDTTALTMDGEDIRPAYENLAGNFKSGSGGRPPPPSKVSRVTRAFGGK